MDRIIGKTREELVNIIAKYLIDSCKAMYKVTNCKLPIELHNWVCGMGRDKHWSSSEISLGSTAYVFKDKEIGDNEFIKILNKAIEKSGVRAKVFKEEYNTGWYETETRFKCIEIYAEPCKEFKTLSRLIEKYCHKVLGATDVFSVSVCGKRSSWSDSGRFQYLCYDPTMCKGIIDYIRSQKSSKDTLTIDVEEYFSHGDDTDYKIAQYQESEWYGFRGSKLVVSVRTPKGKGKAFNKWCIRGYED